MNYGLETQMDVEAVNTLVTIIASFLVLFLGCGLWKWLARRFWQTSSKGTPTDMLVSKGFDGFTEFVWKVFHSAGGERMRMIGDLLPYIVIIAILQLIPFSTSGVSATAGLKQGRSVMVIGSLRDPAYEPIDTLSLEALMDLQLGERAAPFLLGSPELGNYGTNVSSLAWSVYYSGVSTGSMTIDGGPDLKIYGSGYTVEQDGVGMGTFAVSTCLVVSEDNGDYTVDTCEGVQVEIEPLDIVVEGRQTVTWSQDGCSSNTEYAVFNQGVSFKERVLTLVETSAGTFTESEMVKGTTVTALCAHIFESIIEACIFEVGSHVYVGDWNPADYDYCDDDSDPLASMVTVEVEGKDGTLLTSDEFEVAASMFAEVVAGSGKITSRQQLSLILGIFSRMSCMKIGVGTAYYPETVVIVSISPVVLVLWGLLFVVGLVVYLREICVGTKVFIPSTAWDWFAVGARECLGDEDSSCSDRPANQNYAARYGLGKHWVNDLDGVITQPMRWTRVQHKYEGGAINGKEPTSQSKGSATWETLV